MIDDNTLLLLKSAGIGDGEPDLGTRLMGAFLDTLYGSGNLPAKIICLNSGIFLTTEGSPVLDTLRNFEEAGTRIFSCTTCLNYYGRSDQLRIGQPSNMKETVADLQNFGKVMAP